MSDTEEEQGGKDRGGQAGFRFWPELAGTVLASAVIILAVVVVPLFNIAAALAAAVPLALFTARRGPGGGMAGSAAVWLLLATFLGTGQATAAWLQFAGPAVLYGQALRRRWPAGGVVAGGLAAFLAGTLLSLALLPWPGGPGFGAEADRLAGWVNIMLESYRNTGLLESLAAAGMDEQTVRDLLTRGVTMVWRLAPGLLVSTGLLVAGGNFLLARLLALRAGLAGPGRPFREWRLPWYTTWGVIAALGLWLAGDFLRQEAWVTGGQNMLLALALPLLVLGTAVAAFFLARWRLAPAWHLILLLVALLNLPLAIVFLVILGAFDPLVNYRRLPDKEGT